MNVSILCSDERHPVVPELRRWQAEMGGRGHAVELHHDKAALRGGDILFLVSCTVMVTPAERAAFGAVLVLHASDLPRGRGWSPHVWAVLGGAKTITLSLLEACEPVDSGDIWLQATFELEGHELLPEINAKLFAAELALMTAAVERRQEIRPRPQEGVPGPSLRRRRPEDSRLDPQRPLAEQFNLLRTVDNERFPAFFELHGKRYILRIEKAPE